MLANIVTDYKMAVTRPCYMSGNADEIAEADNKHLPAILAYLGEKTYLCGNTPSYVDFYFFEAIQCPQSVTNGATFTNFPRLSQYNDAMKALIGATHLASCHDASLPFNNKVAKLNGTGAY